MTSFTNVFEVEIENKPFYQESVGTWRVARYENGELERVYENKGFETEAECLAECTK